MSKVLILLIILLKFIAASDEACNRGVRFAVRWECHNLKNVKGHIL
jgi:hypothetical protein